MEQKLINWDSWHNDDDLAMIFHYDVVLKDATLLVIPDGLFLLVYPDDRRLPLAKCDEEIYERIKSMETVLCQRVSANVLEESEAKCIPVLVANECQSSLKL